MSIGSFQPFLGAGNVNILSGSLDLNNQGSIQNVGAAGNDWTQNNLKLAGGALEQTVTLETTGANVDVQTRLKIPASSTGNCGIFFTQGSGAGDANNMEYILFYSASNAYLVLSTQDSDGGATRADIFRVIDGQTAVDANTTWDDNAFDDYDDARVLSPYRDGKMNLEARKKELIEMGVLRQYDDGWVGYNDQRMAALLAGGIYQSRALLDALEERLTALEAT